MPRLSAAIVIAFALAVAAGIAGFQAGGAPSAYAKVNAGAAVLAIAIAAIMQRLPVSPASLIALCACPLIAAATLVISPDIDGVQRWLPLGPIRLHAAALLGPAFAIALQARDDRVGIAACVVMAAVLFMQPDLGTSIALVGAAALSLVASRSPGRITTLAIALAGCALTATRPDSLQPVRFVEGVLQDLAQGGWALTIIAASALLAAILAPSLRAHDRNTGGLAVSGWYLGFLVASLAGNYPTPLIGYGAGPIIGYGIAIGLLGRGRQSPGPVRRNAI